MKAPFKIYEASGDKVPIILSVPHCGTDFPKALSNQYSRRLQNHLDDTDWYVHKLYKFANEMGITIIRARYHRWVIDLNRDPDSLPLYNDGRIITGLTPTTDFFGEPVYKKEKYQPNALEVKRRLDAYYWPYYTKLTGLLAARKKVFGKALLWDAHSIRAHVPTISATKFPDMILGDNDQKTAAPQLINAALTTLSSGRYQVNHNDPFKGGHITRYFGKPEHHIHALQLEMNKILYMDDRELMYHEDRAVQMQEVLKKTLAALLETLKAL